MQLKAVHDGIINQLKIALEVDFTEAQALVEARAEASLLLCKVLDKEKSYLYAYSDDELSLEQCSSVEQVLKRRLSGEPLAYIFEEQEFWSLPFYVDRNVLIPRADTESLVEAALELPLPEQAVVVDLGTGSGAIAITLQRERHAWQVFASDCSGGALGVASKNAEKLSIKNKKPAFFCGDWMSALKEDAFDLVVSNPPYIDAGDEYVTSLTNAEPSGALFSDHQGLADLEQLLIQAMGCVRPGGWVLLEHGFQQSTAVIKLAEQIRVKGKRYIELRVILDLSGRERAFLARVAS